MDYCTPQKGTNTGLFNIWYYLLKLKLCYDSAWFPLDPTPEELLDFLLYFLLSLYWDYNSSDSLIYGRTILFKNTFSLGYSF